MPSNLADSTAELKRLVHKIMRESDPARYDELGSEIWRALHDRELLIRQNGISSPDPFDSLEIVMVSLKIMESTVLGMKQIRRFVGSGVATEMLDALIQEAELQMTEIKRRVIN
jgi:hypothetical protein